MMSGVPPWHLPLTRQAAFNDRRQHAQLPHWQYPTLGDHQRSYGPASPTYPPTPTIHPGLPLPVGANLTNALLPPPLVQRLSFRRRAHRFYTVGRAFRGVLSERAGDQASVVLNGKYIRLDCFGKPVISKPRILIVVEQHHYFCVVVPVTTYGNRGFDKPIVEASHHAYVYTKHSGRPCYSYAEPKAQKMLQEAVEVVSDNPENPLLGLCEGSMIDFGKTSYFHHNQEAEAFGLVIGPHLAALMRNYTAVRCLLPASPQPDSPPHTPSLATAPPAHPTLRSLLQSSGTSIHKYITNDGGVEDQKDPDYRYQPKGFFCFGKVFRLLSWCEDPDDDLSDITDMVHGWSAEGAPIIQKELRLLVIQEGKDSCLCLRISTYLGRGLSDLPAGLHTADHAVVHTGKDLPALSPKEQLAVAREGPPVGYIRVKQLNREEKLPARARVLMTRVYKVQLDVKAKEFGRVASTSERTLEVVFKQLNPSSEITVQKPKRKQIANDPRRTLPLRPISGQATTASRNTQGRSDGSEGEASGDDALSSTSSSDINNIPEVSRPSQMFNPGDDVALLLGASSSSTFPHFPRCRIRTALLRRNDVGKAVWMYNLKHSDHEGHYLGETCVEERFLMPI